MGQPFMASGAGPLDAFNHSISFMVECDDQAEIDRLWGSAVGRRKDRAVWVVERSLRALLADRAYGARRDDEGLDRARTKRVAEVMLK
jgi:predicted 3-demethylubiquinone-9 3-methyltransferase (glyoxalase superfamily)